MNIVLIVLNDNNNYLFLSRIEVERESSARISITEADDPLTRSTRKVKWKSDDGEHHAGSKIDAENDKGKGIGHADVSYRARLLDSAVPFLLLMVDVMAARTRKFCLLLSLK